MNIKKIFLAVIFILLITNLGFSQSGMGFGIMGSYNPFNPSFWSVGPVFSFGSYSDKSANIGRMAMTFGQTTLTFETENPFSSKHEMTEYWQKSFYMDWIVGYVHQTNLANIFALRFGGDIYFSFSSAYMFDGYITGVTRNPYPFNFGLTGTVGLALFPKGKFSVLLDACPGFTFNPLKQRTESFALILPIRLTLSFN